MKDGRNWFSQSESECGWSRIGAKVTWKLLPAKIALHRQAPGVAAAVVTAALESAMVIPGVVATAGLVLEAAVGASALEVAVLAPTMVTEVANAAVTALPQSTVVPVAVPELVVSPNKQRAATVQASLEGVSLAGALL